MRWFFLESGPACLLVSVYKPSLIHLTKKIATKVVTTPQFLITEWHTGAAGSLVLNMSLKNLSLKSIPHRHSYVNYLFTYVWVNMRSWQVFLCMIFVCYLYERKYQHNGPTVWDWNETYLRVSLVLQVVQAKQPMHQALFSAEMTVKKKTEHKTKNTVITCNTIYKSWSEVMHHV